MTERLNCNCPADTTLQKGLPTRRSLCPHCGKPRLQPSPDLAVPEAHPAEWLPAPPLRSPPTPALPTEISPVIDVHKKLPDINRKGAQAASQGKLLPDGGLARRVGQNRIEQQRICLVLGTAIVGWSLFSLLPGGLVWQSWLANDFADPLPRWLALNLVYGATPSLLGIFLIQVPHWTTLQAIAAGLLAWACGYAFAAPLFGLAGPDTAWLGWLQFPIVNTSRATVWCLAMLIIAALLSLACYREGQRWRRIEELLTELKLRGEG